jgi:ADP-dependent NAD(P)H-hydrate dehydratase
VVRRTRRRPRSHSVERTAVRETLAKVDLPVVVDAVAIEPALSGDLSNTVFTPDDAEEEAIVEEYGSLETFSESTGAIVVTTGDVDTIIVDGDRTTNETGTPALTVAGTGDTLTGVVAALLGQGLNRAEAAELGAWIVGKAGELATAERGNGLVATDVIDRIPDTIR